MPAGLRRRAPFPGCCLSLVLACCCGCCTMCRDPAVWHDEAAMILNVLAKDFGALLGPLLHYEAAPPLFLWLEKACVLLLGDSTYALRLPSLLASCGSLVVLAWLARRPCVPRRCRGRCCWPLARIGSCGTPVKPSLTPWTSSPPPGCRHSSWPRAAGPCRAACFSLPPSLPSSSSCSIPGASFSAEFCWRFCSTCRMPKTPGLGTTRHQRTKPR